MLRLQYLVTAYINICMKNFKYLDIDNIELVSEKIYNYIRDTTDILQVSPWNPNWLPLSLDVIHQVPELGKFISDLNLDLRSIHVLRTWRTSKLHVDTRTDIRINFPVSNTLGSAVTHFYELKDCVRVEKFLQGYSYYDLEYSDQKIIDSYVLDRPVAFNPDVPHQVVHAVQETTPRLILTMSFHNPPTYLLDDEII